MPFLQPLIIRWNHVYFVPPVHITYLQPRPLEYNSWLSCLPSPFYWHCCSGFLRFSSRRPRELGNMKFHALCVLSPIQGFKNQSVIMSLLQPSKSCSSVLDTGRSYPRYLSLVPNVHWIGFPSLPGTLITYFFMTNHLKNPVAWNCVFTTCFSGLGIYRECHRILQGLF